MYFQYATTTKIKRSEIGCTATVLTQMKFVPYIYIYICACIHIYTYVHIYVYICKCICKYV